MIKLYGSNTCPVTLHFMNTLMDHGVKVTLINVTGSIDHLKDFIQFRDTHPVFDDVRGTPSIGFPLIQLEDGTYTRDREALLKTLGIQ